MKLLSSFLVIFAFLAVSGCTGSDTVTVVETQVYCSTTGKILMEGEECPKPETDSQQTNDNNQGTTGGQNQGGDQDRDTTPPDCNIHVAVDDLEYTAGSGDERVCGNEKNNVIRGGEGDDTLYGRAGDDTLYGELDRDTLKGEGGNDILIGGGGNDKLDGGEEFDTADYSQDGGTVGGITVDLAVGTAKDTYGDDDTLTGIEKVIGTSEADVIKGNEESNVIDGNWAVEADKDEDELDGRGGEDTIVVTIDFDLAEEQDATTMDRDIRGFENIEAKNTVTTALTLEGDNEDNKITGGDSAGDTLNGRGGVDTLRGLRGDDKLNGGAGNDKLYGGIGGDCFLIEIPAAFPDVATIEPTASSDSNNNDRKTIIGSTKDTIFDYGEGDSIVIGGDTTGGTKHDYVATGEMATSKDDDIAVKSVIVRNGRIDIVTQAYRAAAGSDTPDDTSDDVRTIPQQMEQLVVVSGLTAERFETVSIAAACPE